MTLPVVFANLAGPIPLADLDLNFNALAPPSSTSLVAVLTGAGLSAADASSALSLVLSPGTYVVTSSIVLTKPLSFMAGAVLQPAAGVVITLDSAFQAGVYQIFDLTMGGVVALPRSCGEVWAEWWGATGDLVKTNNEVAFNQAWFALAQTVGGGYGGTINFDRGDFYVNGPIYQSDNISIRGHGLFYSLLKVNNAAWAGSNMLLAQAAVPLLFTGPLAAGATSATLVSVWSAASTVLTTVFFETLGGACETRNVTLTNGATTATFSGGLSLACTVNAMALTLTSMFNARVEQCRFDASDLFALTAVIYAPGWQEKCGTDNVYIGGFKSNGIQLDTGYGGAAQIKIRRTEILQAADCVSGSYGINAQYTAATVGWTSIDMEEVQCGSTLAPVTFTGAIAPTATSATLTSPWTFATGVWNVLFIESSGGANEFRLVSLGNGLTTATWSGGITNACLATTSGAVSPNALGINLNGRVIGNVNDVHFEQLQAGFVLQNAACISGTSVQTDGGQTVQTVFEPSASWTGTVNGHSFKKGGAATYITDSNRTGWALATVEPYDDYLQWPPNPGKAFAAGHVTGGSSPAIAWQKNPFGTAFTVAHQATGQQRVTIPAAMPATLSYDVQVDSADASAPLAFSVNVDTTHFDIYTRSLANAATDSASFTFRVYPSPS